MILLRPVPLQFHISQRFGENPNIYPATNGHNGIDFGLPEGNPVMAAADGVVTRAELDTTTAATSAQGIWLSRAHPAPRRFDQHLRSFSEGQFSRPHRR